MGYASYFEDIFLRTPDFHGQKIKKHPQSQYIPIDRIPHSFLDFPPQTQAGLQYKEEVLNRMIELQRENKALREENENLRERLQRRMEQQPNLPEYDDTCSYIIQVMSFLETHEELQAAVRVGEPLRETITKYIDRYQPAYVEGLLRLGHLYFRLDEYDKTDDCMKNVINICQTIEDRKTLNEAIAHLYLGCSAFEQQKFHKSEEELMKAEEMGISAPHLELYFGMLYHQKEQYNQALEYLNKVDADKLPVALYEIALIEYQRRNYKSALHSLQQFLRHEPRHAEAQQLELVCRAMQGESIPNLTHHAYYLDLIDFFINGGGWDRVKEIIQHIEQKFAPDNLDSLANRAKFYYYRGRLAEQQGDIISAKLDFECLYLKNYFLELSTEEIVWLTQFWKQHGGTEELNSIAEPMLKLFIMKYPEAVPLSDKS